MSQDEKKYDHSDQIEHSAILMTMVETVEKIWIITFPSAILTVSLAFFRRDNEDSGDRRIEKNGICMFRSK